MTTHIAVPALQGSHLDVDYHNRHVIRKMDITIPGKQITALVGPNGSGKSTLLKVLTRVMQPARGAILLNGTDMLSIPAKQLAQSLSFLPQGPVAPEGVTVRELIGYGRFPHQRLMGGASQLDLDAVEEAIRLTGLSALADKAVDELSGGQRQKAWIAMSLAQQTDMMFLDEPTTFLDIAHQIDVLELLKKLNVERQCTVVMVLHDLNYAARYADHIIALKDGAIVAKGSPEEILSESVLQQVFGIGATIFKDPLSGRPWFIPKFQHIAKSIV